MRRQRGQTLVLFALSVLTVAVGVIVTLSVGMKAREKMELQLVADASAYSNAVQTARVYNQIAVWNRAQIAHMVTMAGAQSHISFATWYAASAGYSGFVAGPAMTGIAAGICAACGPWCPICCCWCPTIASGVKFTMNLIKEWNDAKKQLKNMDQAAAMGVKAVQMQAEGYGFAGQGLFVMNGISMGMGGMAQQVVDLAKKNNKSGGEYGLDTVANLATGMEQSSAGVSAPMGDNYPSMSAGNGSRRDSFIRTRMPYFPPKQMVAALKSPGLAVYTPSGMGGFAASGKHDTVETGKGKLWADDEGWQFTMIWAGCPVPFGGKADAEVTTTAKGDNGDKHTGDYWVVSGNQQSMHDSMENCKDQKGAKCPSIWAARQEFNIDPTAAQKAERERPKNSTGAKAGAAAQWLQPRSVVKVTRSYSGGTRDPWNVQMQLGLNQGKGSQKFDSRTKNSQAAVATGITYYHRHMQSQNLYWVEPPNFFNPFWRATLVPIDIDGNSDQMVTGGEAFLALKFAGFKGIQ